MSFIVFSGEAISKTAGPMEEVEPISNAETGRLACRGRELLDDALRLPPPQAGAHHPRVPGLCTGSVDGLRQRVARLCTDRRRRPL